MDEQLQQIIMNTSPEQLKNTRYKEHEAYICFGPDKTNNKKNIFYMYDAAGLKRDAEKAVLAFEFYDGTPVNSESLRKRVVKGAEGGMIVPWTKVKRVDCSSEFKAIYVNKEFNCTAKKSGKGTFIVIPVDRAGNILINLATAIDAVVFAKMFSLNAFPNILSDIDISIDEPEEIFKPLRNEDKLKKEDIEAFANKIVDKYGKLETAVANTPDGKLKLIAGKGAVVITIVYEEADKYLLEELKTKSFTLRNGETGSEMTENSNEVQEFKGSNGLVDLRKLLDRVWGR